MISVYLYINGTRRLEHHSWPSVPRTGDFLTLTMEVPAIDYRVTRVHWLVAGSTMVARVYIKPAYTQP